MCARRRSVRHRAAVRPPPVGNGRSSPADNHLLAALGAEDYARIASTLDIVPLKLKDIIHKPGEPIRHVYFPGGGFCSVLTVLEDGNMVEVATVGSEGMVGTSVLFGDSPPSSTAMVQGETEICYRMAADACRVEMDRRGAFFELLTRYAHAFVGFIMQSTACNAVHSIEQRLARWLLMAQDRMGSETFPLTQEFVAMMLGATRPTVSVVAGTLQRAGLITYHRGHVTVVDRARLEASSCECYATATNLLRDVTNHSSR
jgi:CRP-like cAMP-binding protein